MELFGFTDDIFEQQECMYLTKLKDIRKTVITQIEEQKDTINEHYNTLKDLATNRMSVLKESFEKLIDDDRAHY